jgi:hypothetical protein
MKKFISHSGPSSPMLLLLIGLTALILFLTLFTNTQPVPANAPIVIL